MTLGKEELQAGWRIGAVPTLQGVIGLSKKIIAYVDMTPDGPPDVRFYPTQGGKGGEGVQLYQPLVERLVDRKSTRLNSSHLGISYAVFCLKQF